MELIEKLGPYLELPPFKAVLLLLAAGVLALVLEVVRARRAEARELAAALKERAGAHPLYTFPAIAPGGSVVVIGSADDVMLDVARRTFETGSVHFASTVSEGVWRITRGRAGEPAEVDHG